MVQTLQFTDVNRVDSGVGEFVGSLTNDLECRVVVLTFRIEAHVSERRELVQALLAWAESARHQPGAQVVHVYEDCEAPVAFCLVAEWESRPTMEARLRGPEFGVLLGALDLLSQSPQVSIAEVSRSNGTDAVRAIRRAGHSSH